MDTIKLLIAVAPVTIEVEKADYQEDWDEENEDEEGIEPSDDFVIERVTADFENGERDLSEAFENAPVTVKKVG